MISYLLPLLLVAGGHVSANTAGPPIQTSYLLCQDMFPHGHGASTAVSAAPYQITASKTTYATGQLITVSVAATDGSEIEGVFLQARRQRDGTNQDEAIGVFSNPPTKTQLLACGKPNNAWSHSGEVGATTVTVSWTWSCDEGPLAFMATIVKGPKELFWTGVLSTQITFTGTNSSECGLIPSPTRPSGAAGTTAGAQGGAAGTTAGAQGGAAGTTAGAQGGAAGTTAGAQGALMLAVIGTIGIAINIFKMY